MYVYMESPCFHAHRPISTSNRPANRGKNDFKRFRKTLSSLSVLITCMLPGQVVDYRQCEWRVRASPNGTLRDLETNKDYPYLFWEADSGDGRVVQSFNLSGTSSFCVAGNKAGM